MTKRTITWTGRPGGTGRTARWRVLVALLLATLLGVAAACSGGSVDAMSAADGDAADADRAVAEAPSDGGGFGAEQEPLGGDDARGPVGSNRTVFEARAIIRNGEVLLTAKDLDAARTRVEIILSEVDGVVEHEQTTHDDEGGIRRSTLVLRVPVSRFDDAMRALERIGTTRHSDTSAQDVTTEVIDIDERVETLQNSLDRLQSYQAEAKDLEDLLRFEQQITQREAELQSLKAQQTYLADQTSMATIRLSMSRPPEIVGPPELDDAGFLAGLRSGWNALRGAVVVMLTVVGAVTPFAVVLAVAGVPAWLLVRRMLRQPAGAAPVATTPAGPTASSSTE